MEEARRFIRYVFPGVAASIEFLLLVYLSSPSNQEFPIKLNLDIGGSISAILVITGLGYLFSMFHHTLLWTLYPLLGLAPNYRPLFIQSVKDNLISLNVLNDPNIDMDNENITDCLKIKGAWRLHMALWHERLNSSEFIKSTNKRADSLSDIVHGAGSTFAGSIIAVIAWLYIIDRYKLSDFGCIPYWIAIVLIIINLYGLIMTSKHAQSFVQIVLHDSLYKESRKGIYPVTCFVTKKDVTDSKITKYFLRIFFS